MMRAPRGKPPTLRKRKSAANTSGQTETETPSEQPAGVENKPAADDTPGPTEADRNREEVNSGEPPRAKGKKTNAATDALSGEAHYWHEVTAKATRYIAAFTAILALLTSGLWWGDELNREQIFQFRLSEMQRLLRETKQIQSTRQWAVHAILTMSRESWTKRKIDLSWAPLNDTDLAGTHFEDVHLEHADFRNSRLDGAHFDGAFVCGANFDEARPFNRSELLEKANGCDHAP